ncbi:uncharacterized protein LOC128854447 [Cuculus canorus]|uniref:uncharacterized protein LOC128854447 n=1 Tax=Cuculus canorus TaxID=55661 RepID=UPI0023AAF33F|nr:uncharacterized protein LOC128854447 [Cuculus canorus]
MVPILNSWFLRPQCGQNVYIWQGKRNELGQSFTILSALDKLLCQFLKPFKSSNCAQCWYHSCRGIKRSLPTSHALCRSSDAVKPHPILRAFQQDAQKKQLFPFQQTPHWFYGVASGLAAAPGFRVAHVDPALSPLGCSSTARSRAEDVSGGCFAPLSHGCPVHPQDSASGRTDAEVPGPSPSPLQPGRWHLAAALPCLSAAPRSSAGPDSSDFFLQFFPSCRWQTRSVRGCIISRSWLGKLPFIIDKAALPLEDATLLCDGAGEQRPWLCRCCGAGGCSRGGSLRQRSRARSCQGEAVPAPGCRGAAAMPERHAGRRTCPRAKAQVGRRRQTAPRWCLNWAWGSPTHVPWLCRCVLRVPATLRFAPAPKQH